MRLRPARSPPPPVTGAARTGRRVSAGGGGDTCARSPTPRGPGAGQRGGQRAPRRAGQRRAGESRAGGGRCAALGSAPPRERAGGGGGASPSAAGSALCSGAAAQSPHGAVGLPRGSSASRRFRRGCAERWLRCRPRATALARLRQAVVPALAQDTGSARPVLRLGAGAAPARTASPEASAGLPQSICHRLLPVIPLSTELSELSQNK